MIAAMDYTEARAAFFSPRAGQTQALDWSTPARRLRDAIEPLATICFWSEPAYDEYAALGLDFLQGYIYSRASVLGDPEAADGLDETIEALRAAAAAAPVVGRPLFAGLSALAWPADPWARLWHACSLLREHRGDSHLAAVVAAGLDGCQPNVATTGSSARSVAASIRSRRARPSSVIVPSATSPRRHFLTRAAPSRPTAR